MLPVESLTAVLKTADAWVEFNNKWLLYSTVYDRVMAENKRLRHLVLVGSDVDMLVRCVGRVDYDVLGEFETRFADMTYAAKHVRLTTPAGGDVEFDNSHESWGVGYGGPWPVVDAGRSLHGWPDLVVDRLGFDQGENRLRWFIGSAVCQDPEGTGGPSCGERRDHED